MNRKIIIGVVIATLVGLVLFAGYAIQSSEKAVDNSTLTADHYYVEKGLENFAKATKPAIENYATQYKNESTDSRTQRLNRYFTSKSPVYKYELNNLSPSVTKSTAKLTSVTSKGVDDTGTVTLSVIVYVIFYTNNGTFSTNQTYDVFFVPDSNGKYTKPYDIQEQTS